MMSNYRIAKYIAVASLRVASCSSRIEALSLGLGALRSRLKKFLIAEIEEVEVEVVAMEAESEEEFGEFDCDITANIIFCDFCSLI